MVIKTLLFEKTDDAITIYEIPLPEDAEVNLAEIRKINKIEIQSRLGYEGTIEEWLTE